MATVPLSAERRRQIERHLDEMEEADLKTELPDFNENSDLDAGEFLTKIQFYPHVAVAAEIPRAWLMPMGGNQCRVQIYPKKRTLVKTPYSGDVLESMTALLDVGFQNSTNAYYRPTNNRYQQGTTELSVDELRALGPEYYCPAHTHLLRCLDLLPQVEAHREKWTKVKTQLKGLLAQATTVNMAMRAFPELKFYLPQEIIDKVNKQVVKTEAKVVNTEDMDFDVLTATGVAALLGRRNEGQS